MSVEINPKQARQDVEEWINRGNQKFLLEEFASFDNERSGFDYKEKLAEGFKYAVIVLPYQAILFLSEDEEMVAERKGFIDQHGGSENVEFYKTHAGEVVVLFKK